MKNIYISDSFAFVNLIMQYIKLTYIHLSASFILEIEWCVAVRVESHMSLLFEHNRCTPVIFQWSLTYVNT